MSKQIKESAKAKICLKATASGSSATSGSITVSLNGTSKIIPAVMFTPKQAKDLVERVKLVMTNSQLVYIPI